MGYETLHQSVVLNSSRAAGNRQAPLAREKSSSWRKGLWLPVIFFTVFLSAQSTGSEATMEEELGLVGASADDTEAELIRSICETELLDGKCGCHQGTLAPSACVKAHVWWVTDSGGRLFASEGNTVIFVRCQFLRRLSVSLLCLAGGGFSMVKVSQPVL